MKHWQICYPDHGRKARLVLGESDRQNYVHMYRNDRPGASRQDRVIPESFPAVPADVAVPAVVSS